MSATVAFIRSDGLDGIFQLSKLLVLLLKLVLLVFICLLCSYRFLIEEFECNKDFGRIVDGCICLNDYVFTFLSLISFYFTGLIENSISFPFYPVTGLLTILLDFY